MRRIKFQGRDYILTGYSDGAIATPEAYASFGESYAHLWPNGIIMRLHQRIGTIEDIEFLEEVPEAEELAMTKKGMASLLKKLED